MQLPLKIRLKTCQISNYFAFWSLDSKLAVPFWAFDKQALLVVGGGHVKRKNNSHCSKKRKGKVNSLLLMLACTILSRTAVAAMQANHLCCVKEYRVPYPAALPSCTP
jgi:hypothetical protein